MTEEVLIYEKSRSGRTGFSLAETRAGDKAVDGLIPDKFLRSAPPGLPEISKPELVRHYIEMSTRNHHIDKALYPLGSCTMKYNPKLNDAMASLPGFANLHPLANETCCQGAVELIYHLSGMLAEITGFSWTTMQPVAGAQCELVGLLIIRAAMKKRGNVRRKIIIPDSAHGTNPASVIMAGYEVVQVKSTDMGILSATDVARVMDEETAGIMITNPNTLGLFESEIDRIAKVVHDGGGLLYMDGANLNALLGHAKPAEMGFDMVHFNLHKTFSTPHGGGGPGAGALAVTEELIPFLPKPVAAREDGRYYLDYDRKYWSDAQFLRQFRGDGKGLYLYPSSRRRGIETSFGERRCQRQLLEGIIEGKI
jgi:glycine dehydrogenase subunit 2